MVSRETQEQISSIDKQIKELAAQRLKLATESDASMLKSEAAIKNRAYEREFMSSIESHDINMESCERVLFRTLFNLSHSYSASQIGHKSALSEQISKALTETPKVFPTKALVACQGVEGAYSQIACDKMFNSANIMFFRTFDGVFQAVENGMVEYGVLPIENSSYGSVTAVYDLMKSHKFHIVRAKKLQISHRLMVKPGTKFEEIKEVIVEKLQMITENLADKVVAAGITKAKIRTF